jgi:hypothetical protein
MVYSFWNSPEAEYMTPNKNSQDVLQKLKLHGYSLTVVTGRQTYAKKCTETFIEKYYPGIFDDVILTNSYSLCGESVSKQQVCEDIDANYLIDDTEYQDLGSTIPLHYVGHPEECLKLYGTPIYPWCLDSRSSLKIPNWKSVEDFLINGLVPPLRPENILFA